MYDAQTDDPVGRYIASRMIDLVEKHWGAEQIFADALEAASPTDVARMALEEAERSRASLKGTFSRSVQWATLAFGLRAAIQRHERTYLSYTIADLTFHGDSFHGELTEVASRGEGTTAITQQAEPAPTENSESQLKLRMDETFTPSVALTQYWLNGIRAFSSSAPVAPTELLGTVKQSEVAQEFAKLLTATLGTIGQQLRYDEKPQATITDGGRFTVAFQLALSDRFLIIPDEAGKFFELLSRELIAALRTGARLQGAWGRVAVNNQSDLQYQLAKPNFVRDPKFVESEDVE